MQTFIRHTNITSYTTHTKTYYFSNPDKNTLSTLKWYLVLNVFEIKCGKSAYIRDKLHASDVETELLILKIQKYLGGFFKDIRLSENTQTYLEELLSTRFVLIWLLQLVLLKLLVKACCEGMLWRHVVKACCEGMLWRHVVKACCEGMLWRHIVKACWEGMSWRHVVKACREGMLWRRVVKACALSDYMVLQNKRPNCWWVVYILLCTSSPQMIQLSYINARSVVISKSEHFLTRLIAKTTSILSVRFVLWFSGSPHKFKLYLMYD